MARTAKKATTALAGKSRRGAQARYAMFVEMYFIHKENATQAAIASGYSAKTAGIQGYKLINLPQISAAIAKRRAELVKKCEFTAEEVIRSLARAVRFDPRKLYHPDGRLKTVPELDDETAMELEGFDIETVFKKVEKVVKGKKVVEYVPVPKIKYDLPKKSASRDQAMKHFGLYAKDKAGAVLDEDTEPPPSVAVTVNFKDARRKPKED